MNNCHKRYNKFTKNGNLKKLKECYSSNLQNLDVKDEFNPLKNQEVCKLVTSKKEKYYIHKYKPQKTIKKLNKLGKEGANYLSHVLKIFDFTERENCCNCVSLSLYAVRFQDLIDRYVPSIIKTIKNVAQSLPDWIVRIYMDSSVFEVLQEQKKSLNSQFIENSLDFFFEAENVEIYTYFCDSVINKEIDIARTRMLRFMPIIDENVKCSAIREADGIVSNLDCLNLRNFSNSKKIFYVVPYSRPYGHFNRSEGKYRFKTYNEYSIWLIIYKRFMEHEYFSKKDNLIYLLAGVISLNLTVKKEYFQEVLNDLSYRVSDFIINNERFSRLMQMGFDEILLMGLFKDLISAEIKLDEFDKIESFNKKQTKVINAMIDHFEIKIFKFDERVNEVLKIMVDNGFLKESSIKKLEELLLMSDEQIEFLTKNENNSLKTRYFDVTLFDYFLTDKYLTKKFMKKRIMCDFVIDNVSVMELLQVTYRDYYYLTDYNDKIFEDLIEMDLIEN